MESKGQYLGLGAESVKKCIKMPMVIKFECATETLLLYMFSKGFLMNLHSLLKQSSKPNQYCKRHPTKPGLKVPTTSWSAWRAPSPVGPAPPGPARHFPQAEATA